MKTLLVVLAGLLGLLPTLSPTPALANDLQRVLGVIDAVSRLVEEPGRRYDGRSYGSRPYDGGYGYGYADPAPRRRMASSQAIDLVATLLVAQQQCRHLMLDPQAIDRAGIAAGADPSSPGDRARISRRMGDIETAIAEEGPRSFCRQVAASAGIARVR